MTIDTTKILPTNGDVERNGHTAFVTLYKDALAVYQLNRAREAAQNINLAVESAKANGAAPAANRDNGMAIG